MGVPWALIGHGRRVIHGGLRATERSIRLVKTTLELL